MPISSLRKGQKVLATSTASGKTSPEPVAAVLVHHDTDLYDLTVRTAHGQAVIHTTRSHLFWDAGGHRWVKAAALRYGTRLHTPAGGPATVLGGHNPPATTGWMWDLTIPGGNDHDFYVGVSGADILVHNEDDPAECGDALSTGTAPLGDTSDLVPGYKTFSAAKSDLGSPGVGNVFDHTVEQSQIGRSGFAPDEIHSPYNLNPVPAGLNQLKANYYSSIRAFTGGLTVRGWLAGQPFADQYEFSMDILEKLRNGLPLP